MKNRTFWIILICALFLIGCTQPAAEATVQTPEQPAQQAEEDNVLPYATLGDAFAVDPEGAFAWGESYFLYVFHPDESYFRIVAELPQETENTLDALDLFDDDYNEQIRTVVASLPVHEVTDLSQYFPTQAELDQWIGKTGAEMLQDGFELTGYAIYDEYNNFFVDKGLCSYTVAVNEPQDPEAEGFDQEAAFSAATIKSIEFSELTYLATEYPGDF